MWNRQRLRSSLAQYCCDDCLSVSSPASAAALLSQLVLSPRVPPGLEPTHSLCSACEQLHRRDDRHASGCPLAAEKFELVTAGWATDASEALKSDLRSRSRKASVAFSTILELLVENALAGEPVGQSSSTHRRVIVPVPTASSRAGGDPILRAAQRVGSNLCLPVVPAVTRHKHESTRANFQAMRRVISRGEYSLREDAVGELGDAHVLLLDDTVTTGHTMSAVGRKLMAAGAGRVTPVSLDRTVSRRLLQLLGDRVQCGCGHRRSALIRDSSREL